MRDGRPYEQHFVQFRPSRVEGAAGVIAEVAVLPDRIELRGENGGWTTLPLATIAPPPEPPTVFGRFLPGRSKRAPVAAISFSPGRYQDSYVRFLSTPALTLYMPADGPTRFPDSVFSQILRVLSAGGHRFYDVADGPPRRPDDYAHLPRGLRTIAEGVTLVCVANFFLFMATSLYLRGNALAEGDVRNGRYYVGKPHRQHEISRAAWTFSWWQSLTALAGLPALPITGYLADAYAKRLARKRRTPVIP